MLFIYNLIVVLADFILKIVALFSKKIKLFVEGRKNVFKILSDKIKAYDKTIWFHAASLGEYEQGLPVMERMKSRFPNHLIVLTFFSPSGYEVRKNNTIADVTVYLPLDTQSNVEQFMKIVRPDMAFFIKYEYWPNYLNALKDKEIPTYLISGIFREKQVFFKWYGGFYRKALDAFEHFFVQNSSSKELLLQLGKTNVTVSGDTRFDRVFSILNQDNQLDFIEKFKNNTLTVVVGSSWPKDETLLVNYINSSNNVKFIIAPHNINKDQIADLKNHEAEIISSTNIRKALAAADPQRAAAMLGHWHRLEGAVEHGEKRGRELGYPTANMSIEGLQPPAFGVYAVLVDVLTGPHKGSFHGAASIGVRPMFGENRPNCETFIFDFKGDLYGETLSVGLVAYLRSEQTFDGLEALIEQMDADCSQARRILSAL